MTSVVVVDRDLLEDEQGFGRMTVRLGKLEMKANVGIQEKVLDRIVAGILIDLERLGLTRPPEHKAEGPSERRADGQAGFIWASRRFEPLSEPNEN